MTQREADGALVAGVELGGTKCVAILARGPDSVEAELRLPTGDPAETLPLLRKWIEDRGAHHDVAALGIASFGPLQLQRGAPDFGRIVRTTKPGWTDADLIGALAPPGMPVRLDTDVNGAALAEARWGAARGLDSFAYVTVGTGVGVGSIVNGLAVAGIGHSEAGHMRVPRLPGDHWPGGCAFHGDCVEGLASGPAIAAAAGASADTLADDHPALRRAAAALTALCHNLVVTAAPQRILIGGGVASGRPAWIDGIRRALVESLADYAWPDRIASDPEFVRPPALCARAGPLGAIALGQAALSG